MPFRTPILLIIAALLSGAARAQDQSPPETSGLGGGNVPNASGPGGQAFTDPSSLFSSKAGALFGLAFNRIPGEGNYIKTIVNTNFQLGPVGLGLALPLNMLVYPEEGVNRDDIAYNGVIRKRDWDEPLDYFKLVRYVRYGQKRDPVYVLAGQLWGTSIGHGTLVNRYANSLNLDHTKFGIAFDVNTTFFGVETMVDSIGSPGLIGGRAYVRPFGDTPIARGWAIGVTAVSDVNAPRSYINAAGKPSPTLQQDAEGNPLVATDNVKAGGVDMEFEVLHNSVISLIPYVDLNRILGAGNGLHAGALADINLPIPILDVTVNARLEYRMMQAGYIPEYFDQQYDLGRVQYQGVCPGGVPACPKFTSAQTTHNNAADPGAVDLKGWYGELAFSFAGFLQVGGLYQDYDGSPNGASLGLFVTFPKIEVVKLSAYYLRSNMKSGFDDAFALDERSLLAASAAYKLFGPLYMRIDFQRRWVLEPGATSIHAVDNFQAGLATFFPF